MKYNVRITVKNSAGNEQAKVFNFFTEGDIDYTTVLDIVRTLTKDSYSIELKGYYKKHRGKAVSFVELCKALREWRFYETKSYSHEEITHSWEYVTSLRFPCEVFVKQFNSEWGGTFFEITFEDKNLVKPDFDAIKAHLEKYDIDLLKSKTEGLWYSHKFLELTDLRNDILVRRRHTVHEWVNKIEKTEL